MIEPIVLTKTHAFLKSQGLFEQKVMRLFTDAHSSLLSYKTLDPFQRFTVDLGDNVFHPDLVGQLADGETLFAVEGKGETDLLKGLAQAEMYQRGFHYSFLAADAAVLTTMLVDFARSKNLGVIAVSDTVVMINTPQPQMPFFKIFKPIMRQMQGAIQVSGRQTFQFNLPTHYLVWPIILEPAMEYLRDDLLQLLGGYPMPSNWQSALRGAQKLGLVTILGEKVMITDVGAAVKEIISSNINEWTVVHQQSTSGMPMIELHARAAAALRLLLLQEPMVRLVIDGLRRFPNYRASFAELANVCDQLDHTLAPIFFLKPGSAVKLMDQQAQINWSAAIGEDYRSAMFFQYKSILKHAGILKGNRLGGASAKGYEPARDIWELR